MEYIKNALSKPTDWLLLGVVICLTVLVFYSRTVENMEDTQSNAKEDTTPTTVPAIPTVKVDIPPIGGAISEDQLRKAIKDVYKADIAAIKNLSDIANALQKGNGIQIPGKLIVNGETNLIGDVNTNNLNVKGNTTIKGELSTGNINGANINGTNIKGEQLIVKGELSSGLINSSGLNTGNINCKQIKSTDGLILSKTTPFDPKSKAQQEMFKVDGLTNLNGTVIVGDDIILDGISLKNIILQILSGFSVSRHWDSRLGDSRAIDNALGGFRNLKLDIAGTNNFWKTSSNDFSVGRDNLSYF